MLYWWDHTGEEPTMAALMLHRCNDCGLPARSSNKRGEWWQHADFANHDHKVTKVTSETLIESY